MDDRTVDYPQSGERIRSRHNIQESRFVRPDKKRFAVRRMIGSGDLPPKRETTWLDCYQ
jgi:hypothetical protein